MKCAVKELCLGLKFIELLHTATHSDSNPIRTKFIRRNVELLEQYYWLARAALAVKPCYKSNQSNDLMSLERSNQKFIVNLRLMNCSDVVVIKNRGNIYLKLFPLQHIHIPRTVWFCEHLQSKKAKSSRFVDVAFDRMQPTAIYPALLYR